MAIYWCFNTSSDREPIKKPSSILDSFIIKKFFLISLITAKQDEWKPFQEPHVTFLQIFENIYNIWPKSFLLQAKHFQLLQQYPPQEKNNELGVKRPGFKSELHQLSAV